MHATANGEIDLRTAQNRVHGFLLDANKEWIDSGRIAELERDSGKRTAFAQETRALLWELLQIPAGRSDEFHMGITDSGKRAIEVMVNAFATGEESQTVAVTTENYVGHNKWSAAQAMVKYKGVPFATPFGLELGQALTVGSAAELETAQGLIRDNVKTFYLPWNGTSTGVEERVDELVAFRNSVGSSTLILADASSLPVLSRRWRSVSCDNLPDAFFFSFRKHPAIPYDGPQDEIEQMKNSGSVIVFGPRAAERASQVAAEPVYDFDLQTVLRGCAPAGEKYATHLLRLNTLLKTMLAGGGEALDAIDATHAAARDQVLETFGPEGAAGKLGFELIADRAAQSFTSFVLRVPEAIRATDLVKQLGEHQISISPALHPLGNTKQHNVVRFGVYSANSVDDVRTMLDALAQTAQGMLTAGPAS